LLVRVFEISNCILEEHDGEDHMNHYGLRDCRSEIRIVVDAC